MTSDGRRLELLLVAPESLFSTSLRDALGTLVAVQGVDVVAVADVPPPPGELAEKVVVVVSSQAERPSDRDVELTTLWLDAAQAAKWLIVLSSAAVHVASHRHPGLVPEDYRGRKVDNHVIAGAWRRLEEHARRITSNRLTLLRPTTVPVAGGSDRWSRLLARRVAAVAMGYDPPMQFLAVEDLARAISAAAARCAPGVFHVAPTHAVPLRAALAAAGVRCVPVPHSLLVGLAHLARWRPWRADAADPETASLKIADESALLDDNRYPRTVSAEALEAELGCVAKRSSLEVVSRRPVTEAEIEARGDAHGFDRAYVQRLGRTLFRFMHDRWWRVQWRGLENIPETGGAVLVGVHRGHQPWDGIMMLHGVAQAKQRYLRFLIHPTLVKFPFIAPYMSKCGGLHATRRNADRVLDSKQLLGVFPEGIRGAFALYRDAYKLAKFGHDEFLRTAIRHRVPIVPFVTVGSAEIFPILARLDWRWWKRLSEWPFLPITPTLSTVPLPSKWHTQILPPISTDHLPVGAEDDAETITALKRRVRELLQATLDDMAARRPAIFWGSIFKPVNTVMVEPPFDE